MMKAKFGHLLLALLFGFIATETYSQSIDRERLSRLKRELETRGGGLVSDLTSRRMTRAANELQAERFDRAVELLESLVEATRANRYEQGLALQMLGTTYIQMDQIDNGIKTLERALEVNSLPYEPTLGIYYTLAQIYLATQKIPQARLKLEEWFFLARTPTPEAQILMGAVFAEEGNFKRALEFVERALSSTPEPLEQWLNFAAGLYYQNNDLARAADIFVRLTTMNPTERRYWRQLSGIYITLDREDEALSAMVLAQKMNLVEEERDFYTLCSLYNYNSIPVNCARLIDEMVKKGEVENRERGLTLLTQAWVSAREPLKAVPYLKELAELRKDARFDAQRGFIFYQLRRWREAQEAFSDALMRGGLEESRKGDVLLSLGISRYQLKEYAAAVETFTQARSLENHRSAADAWLSEVRRQLN
jgi:tetratricopeptide (TPR) repeat protein